MAGESGMRGQIQALIQTSETMVKVGEGGQPASEVALNILAVVLQQAISTINRDPVMGSIRLPKQPTWADVLIIARAAEKAL